MPLSEVLNRVTVNDIVMWKALATIEYREEQIRNQKRSKKPQQPY